MSRPKHYSPEIKRFLVSVLYHEARDKGVPMTVLANQILQDTLKNTDGWKTAEVSMQLREAAAGNVIK